MQTPANPPGATDVVGPIFLSYRQSDGTQIVAALGWLMRAAGIPIWRDRDDLPPGDTDHRLEQALGDGLSGGVLVITPDVAHSAAVKAIEAPGLISMHLEDDRFQLLIANEIADAAGQIDYTAPDRVLERANSELRRVNQYPTTTAGMLQLVQAALWHRMSQHRAEVASTGCFELSIQTRNVGQVYDRTGGQLDIRIRRSHHARLPSSEGLEDLRRTISLLADAVTRTGATAVRVRGGAHLSVAFALGAAMPSSRIGTLQVVDQREAAWMSGSEAVLGATPMTECETTPHDAGTSEGRPRIAIYVDLLPFRSDAAYTRLIRENSPTFSAHAAIRLLRPDLLCPDDAGSLAAEVAAHMRRLSANHDNAEIHLLLRCPFPIAVLLGRLSNTLRVRLYEWDDTSMGSDYRSRYVATLDILTSSPRGPITQVLLDS
jgi:hypothetical protein